MHRDYPLFKLNPVPILYENQEYIRKLLDTETLIQTYYNQPKSSQGVLHLDVTNLQYFPVEILGARIGTSHELEFAEPAEIIQTNVKFVPDAFQSVRFQLPENLEWSESLIPEITIICKIFGSNKVVEQKLMQAPIIDESLSNDLLVRQKTNISDFGFIKVNETQKQILIEKGTHVLNRNLIIPHGYQVLATEGTRLDLTAGANIISYSPLHFTGSSEKPVVISSTDGAGQGVVIIGTQSESFLQYVHFDRLSNPEQSNWQLSSAITFDHSPVKFSHCFFGNSGKGESYLKITRSEFSVNNSQFHRSFRNAFIGKYSHGTIKNTRFSDSGNNAIDIISSQLSFENISIERASNHGLNVGAKSAVYGWKLKVQNTDVAVVCKDLSKVLINTASVKDSRIAYIAMQEQPEYGPANMEIEGSSSVSGEVETAFLVEEGSRLMVTDKYIKSNKDTETVEHILYGSKMD